MSIPSSLRFRLPFAALATAAAAFLGLGSLANAVIDDNATRQIWKLKYGVAASQLADNTWLDQDSDGDGVKNKDEIAAGTNPFSAAATIKVSSVVKNGASVDLQFPTELGKLYRVEKKASLTSGSWAIQAGQLIGTGSTGTLSAPYGANCYYRIRVEEIDTDGDGVSDWAEGASGLNPNSQTSSPGVNDHDYVAAEIALPNVVTIKATAAFASKDGPQAGTLTIERTQKLLPLTVSYTTSGTAVPGTNYATLPGTVNIAAGAAAGIVSVNPAQNGIVEGSKSVTVTLSAATAYALGAPSSATVIINDSTVASGTGLLGEYFDTASTTYASPLNFAPAQLKASRVEPTVNFNWLFGTPNGAVINANESADNYSVVWEGYLSPTTAGAYQFQLDADDKARVFLDQNNAGGLQQILEHGWDGPATVGTFKQSAPFNLAAATRYRIKVEYVETAGNAQCRLQWRAGTAAFVVIPAANVFSNQRAVTYSYTRASTGTSGTIVVTPSGGHNFVVGTQVNLTFSTGNLFTPASYSGLYTVGGTGGTVNFPVAITGAALPGTGIGAGFVDFPTSTTTGFLAKYYPNTSFTAPPTIVRLDPAITNGNNGIWGTGSPDPLIGADTFSARWSGQVQPQFSETYTFIVNADDSARLWINGQPQALLIGSAANATGAYSYNGTTGQTVVTPAALLTGGAPPNSVSVGETVRVDPTSGSLSYGTTTYSYDGTTGNAVISYSALTGVVAGGFAVGQTLFLDPTSGNLSTLTSLPYLLTGAGVPPAKTFTANFGTGVFATGTGNMTITDLRDVLVTAATPNTFTVNFGTGISATGTGACNIDWLNKPIDWPSNTTADRYVRIPMQGGVRYDIKLEYLETTSTASCSLAWYSASQPRQIVPQSRLYPANGILAPAEQVSPSEASALLGGLFSHKVESSNGAVVTVSGNPAWLNYSAGVLSGTPPGGSAGDYQVLITITNAAGTSTSVLNLHVDDTGGTIVREYWNGNLPNGIPGISVANIPVGTIATGTANLTSLEGPTNFGDNYGARVRGYITAPVTGNYYFWIAASNAAELWISNDDEPVNAIKRAWVTSGTGSQDWNNAGETNQKSPWLALEQGNRYYIEILHKAGAGAGDNVAVGWLKPGGTGNAPSEVVPGFVLSPYVQPSLASTPGTLFVATMLVQTGAMGTPGSPLRGVGTSTLRLSADENTAYMKRTFSGLSGPITAEHIHSDPYLSFGSQIIFDIDMPTHAGDGLITNPSDPNFGFYKWTLEDVQPLNKAQIIEILKQGKAYVNLHTVQNATGEIRGNYALADGTRTFTPPPPPPALIDDSNSNAGAARFLTQATFGASPADIAAFRAIVPPSGKTRYEAWIDDQFNKLPSHQLPEVLANQGNDPNNQFGDTLTYNAWWRNSMTGEDQLLQRVAFALSQIHVVSTAGPLSNNATAVSYFYDKLADNAFENFRKTLEDTTLTPAMGRYLDMLRNDKPDQGVGRIPNENYAREIEQLFSIGLFRMWPDGSLMLNSKDQLIPTYTQNEIVGYAHVFTGWDYGYNGALRTTFGAAIDWMRQMREVPGRHFTGPKRTLNNEVLPGLQSGGAVPHDPFATPSASLTSTAGYLGLPAQEFAAVHDQLFNHPNTGPFICRQLIQRLVTSNPSRDYVYRVVEKFNNNGLGERGDMKAVVKAILLDFEARSSSEASKPAFGKQREPLLRLSAAARAFRPAGFSGSYVQTGSGGRTITIDTSTPHRLNNGNSVYLEFSGGAPDPWSGNYTVAAITGTQGSSVRFTVNAFGWTTGTYSQVAAGTAMTVTMGGHWLPAGGKAHFDFTSGPAAAGGSTFDNAVLTAATSTSTDTVAGTTFTIAPPAGGFTTTGTGTLMIPRFPPGSYVVTNSGQAAPNDKRITVSTITDHHLNTGDHVFLSFFIGQVTPVPFDNEFIVDSVVDLNTFTVLSTVTGTNLTTQSDNRIYVFPLLSQPVNRSGTVTSGLSNFALGTTNTDLAQTPLNAPTVFNYFLPDFRYPGTLASQAITTPEFQLTSDTNVVRQTNFFFNGVFNPANTSGLSSFRSGGNSLVMDLSPWMGLAVDIGGLGAGPQPTQAWTSNANLGTLIDRIGALLMGGALPSNAKAIIQNFVSNTTNVPYTDAAPTDIQKRDRIRSVLHLIITSAEYTIQR